MWVLHCVDSWQSDGYATPDLLTSRVGWTSNGDTRANFLLSPILKICSHGIVFGPTLPWCLLSRARKVLYWWKRCFVRRLASCLASPIPRSNNHKISDACLTSFSFLALLKWNTPFFDFSARCPQLKLSSGSDGKWSKETTFLAFSCCLGQLLKLKHWFY